MNVVPRNIIRFIFFILLQVFILDNVPALHRFIIPVIYFLFILWLPFSISRFWLLIIGFLPGCRMIILRSLRVTCSRLCTGRLFPTIYRQYPDPKDTSEFNYNEPSAKAMGWAPYAVYVLHFRCYITVTCCCWNGLRLVIFLTSW
jgi:hypothetical protein